MADGRLSNTIVAASWLTLLSILAVVIAFATPCWLETDGSLDHPKFVKLGLWTVCFEDFQERLRLYEMRFSGCRWVLDEEYQIIDYLVRPQFFIAVQLFFTLCFMACLLSGGLVVLAVCCMDDEREALFLRIISGVLGVAAVCGTISVITFGVLGDSRDWMPDYDHNNLSWSFGLGVVGVVLAALAGLLFWVEARVQYRIRRLQKTAKPALASTV
ncbi:uncharacterized protein LOC119103536 isoform X2 [Pollicipes pollicipes]|uniref:uncharacterized protein LOC119103536 isoform X2 n=1 Tax=Pollicipes pollicipes TaxID=41117 RepID=UPI001885398B|nr:uncharacterized protein LOC119103536 isoform X2 [Pollicipes pollicipes]